MVIHAAIVCLHASITGLDLMNNTDPSMSVHSDGILVASCGGLCSAQTLTVLNWVTRSTHQGNVRYYVQSRRYSGDIRPLTRPHGTATQFPQIPLNIYICMLCHRSRVSSSPESSLSPTAHEPVSHLVTLACHFFCEARRASHCHSPQTTYSSKSTFCTLSAQKTAMYVVVYAGRLIAQNSIVEIINW